MSSKDAPARRFPLGAVPVILFSAVALLFAFALTSGDPSKLPSALIGKPVPQSIFAPVDGLTDGAAAVPGFSTADLAKGKVTVVNFWASWCGPCVDEHPLLTNLRDDARVQIYGVNYKDDPAAARRFLSRYGLPFAAVGTDPDGRRAIDWGVYGMPETFVIDGQGRIAYKHVGPMTAASISQKIIPAIERAAVGATP